MKILLFRISSVMLALMSVLILGEITFRILDLGYDNGPLVCDPYLNYSHPKNYTFTVHDPRGEFGEHQLYYDENGLSTDPHNKNRSKNAIRKIAVMGDSFVEAMQVPYSESFVGALQSKTRESAEIRNYGVSSYSPIYYLLQWRVMVSNFEPTHVFVLLCSNDIETDEIMARSAVYNDGGEILRIPCTRNNWTEFARKSYFVRYIRKIQLKIAWIIEHLHDNSHTVTGNFVEENPDISETSKTFMLTLANEVRQSGSQFTIMAVPSKYRLKGGEYDPSKLEYSDKWKRWAEGQSIDFLDLVTPFKDAITYEKSLFFEQDIHLNKEGHKVIAETLSKAYPDIF